MSTDPAGQSEVTHPRAAVRAFASETRDTVYGARCGSTRRPVRRSRTELAVTDRSRVRRSMRALRAVEPDPTVSSSSTYRTRHISAKER